MPRLMKKRLLFIVHVFAMLLYDEIRAIALCKRKNLYTIRVECIAHAPEQLNAPRELLSMLHSINTFADLDKIRSQPRWYYEELYDTLEIEDDKY